VDEFDGEVVTGRIKVKVGPVSLTYRGTAKFTERDPAAHLVVVEASGKEMRGAGTASATVRATLEPESSGDGTRVSMHTTMNVTGRPAQFGRGVIVEVGGKLVDQFAQNLAKQITAGTGNGTPDPPGVAAASSAPAAAAAPAASSAAAASSAPAAAAASSAPAASASGAEVPASVSTTTAPPEQHHSHGEESLNLVRLVGPALLKRVVPVAIAAAGLALLARQLRRVLGRGAKDGEA
jgi:carbon monoxide dehydrogenase subunit G